MYGDNLSSSGLAYTTTGLERERETVYEMSSEVAEKCRTGGPRRDESVPKRLTRDPT